jgi:hypothetical protein
METTGAKEPLATEMGAIPDTLVTVPVAVEEDEMINWEPAGVRVIPDPATRFVPIVTAPVVPDTVMPNPGVMLETPAPPPPPPVLEIVPVA